MKQIIAIIIFISFSLALCLEIHVDETEAAVDVGTQALFELEIVNTDRGDDTVDVYIQRETPESWSAFACTPYECFYDHAVVVIPGYDSMLIDVHITPETAEIGTVWFCFSSRSYGDSAAVAFSVEGLDNIIEKNFSISLNLDAFPNPFNSVCRIDYSIDGSGYIYIFDCSSRLIFRKKIEGSGVLEWIPENLEAGFYPVKLVSDTGSLERKLLFIK